MGPADAMREAAFLFARPPSAYDGPYLPRAALDAGNGQDLPWVAIPEPGGPDPDADSLAVAEAQERRGRQIVETWQAQARARGTDPLGEAEQRLLLETATNLPADVISRVVQAGAGNAHHVPQPGLLGQDAASPPRTDRPWVHDFPVPIEDVVAAAANTTRTTGPAAAAALANPQARQVGQQP